MQLAEFTLGQSPYPWQHERWQTLFEAVSAQKLPHAILFAGVPGVGKTHLAMLLAQRLLCLTAAAELACGKCKACQLMAVGTHPDLLLLEPEAAGKAIKIDAIRQANDFLSKTAQQGGRKLVVIAPAEAMTTGAANALLKSLEEPAGSAHIILVSHQTSAVLSTIRSRCRLLAFGLPAAEVVVPWLTPIAGNRMAPELLLCLAGGAPLAARGLLDGDALEQHQLLVQNLRALAQGQKGPLALASEWLAQDHQQVLSWFQLWISQLLKNLQWQQASNENTETFDWAVSLLGEAGAPVLHRLYEKVGRARQALAGPSNPNTQLLLEEIALDWQALCRAFMRRSR